jgi:hypothetical protein
MQDVKRFSAMTPVQCACGHLIFFPIFLEAADSCRRQGMVWQMRAIVCCDCELELGAMQFSFRMHDIINLSTIQFALQLFV